MSLNLLGNSCYEVSIVPPQTSLKVKENFNFYDILMFHQGETQTRSMESRELYNLGNNSQTLFLFDLKLKRYITHSEMGFFLFLHTFKVVRLFYDSEISRL